MVCRPDDGTMIRNFMCRFPNGRRVLKQAFGCVVDPKCGLVIVSEEEGHCVTILTRDGMLVREFGSIGEANGQFRSPAAVALTSTGDIAVVDQTNHRIQVSACAFCVLQSCCVIRCLTLTAHSCAQLANKAGCLESSTFLLV